MAVSELNLIFACKDLNCVTDGIWISGVISTQLVGMVCFMLAVEAHAARIDGCASWFYSMGDVGIFQVAFRECDMCYCWE